MPEATPALQLDHLTLRRGGYLVLNDLSWSMPVGGCCAVLGPNGAGKSTLLAVITGHEWPSDGEVTVLGERYGQVELARHRRRIGHVGQSRLPYFPPDQSAYDTVLSGRWGTLIVPSYIEVADADHAAARQELAMVGLAHRAETEFAWLSSGEQTRLMLARALVSHPELLILDEPTAALDMAARARFVHALERLLEARGNTLTILIVTHYVEDLPAGLREVLLLKRGKVVAAGPAAKTLTAHNLSRTFDCAIELQVREGHYIAHARPQDDWEMSW